MFETNIVIKEVSAPINNCCASGHFAPEYFKREGPNSDPKEIRFFYINGNGINGIYCEICLIIANWNASKNKR